MKILDRIRVALLRRQLAEVQAADHAARDQAQTTDDMMHAMTLRAALIVTLQNKIRAIEGEPDDLDDDDPRTPSSMFIPTEGKYK